MKFEIGIERFTMTFVTVIFIYTTATSELMYYLAMSKTAITPLTPSIHEYGIVATFSDATLDSLVAIQATIKDKLGDAVWLAPRQALHSTLMEIICDTN